MAAAYGNRREAVGAAVGLCSIALKPWQTFIRRETDYLTDIILIPSQAFDYRRLFFNAISMLAATCLASSAEPSLV